MVSLKQKKQNKKTLFNEVFGFKPLTTPRLVSFRDLIKIRASPPLYNENPSTSPCLQTLFSQTLEQQMACLFGALRKRWTLNSTGISAHPGILYVAGPVVQRQPVWENRTSSRVNRPKPWTKAPSTCSNVTNKYGTHKLSKTNGIFCPFPFPWYQGA